MEKFSEITEQQLKKTRRYYLLVFGVIFLISALGQGVIQYFIAQDRGDAKVINISGKQRMLSQRIAWYVNKLEREKTKKNYTFLESSLELFRVSHYDLMNGNLKKEINSPFSLEIKKSYQELTPLFEKIVNAAQCILKSCDKEKESREFINNNVDYFLKDMNEIVYANSKYSEERTEFLSKIEIVFFVLICLTMIIEIFFILFPFEQKVRNSIIYGIEQKEKKSRVYHLAELGEMSSEILHEVNNFLTIIHYSNRKLFKIAEKDEDLKNVLTQVENIEMGVTRISDLCKGISSLSRINKTSSFSLQELVKEIHVLLEGRIKKYDIDFRVNIRANAFVETNKSQMIQVLFNLIKNAIHATEFQREKIIKMDLYLDRTMLFIEVSDNGPGIPSEIQEKIFHPYFTTKKEGKGTGLGLSLSRKIAIALGGSLLVTQSSEEGTTFVFSVENKSSERSEIKKSA
jgi:signal transduction histidine kinase